MISKEQLDLVLIKLQEAEDYAFKITGQRVKYLIDFSLGSLNKEKDHQIASVIISEMASYFNVSENNIKSNSRATELATIRQYCYKLIRENTNLKLKEIGRLFSNRDHASIIAGLKQFENHYTIEKEFKLNYLYIKNTIQKKLYEHNSATPTNDESPAHQ